MKSARAPRPFEKGSVRFGGSDLNTLFEWLCENVDPTLRLGPDYTVDDLTDDLNDILDAIWSDSIDAMGEDA